MITLFQFGEPWGFDPSPFCVKLKTYLKLAGIPFLAKPGNMRDAPKGKLPYIAKADGTLLGDSGLAVAYLKAEYGDRLDAHLTPRQRAEAHALRRMLEENLYWVAVYSRWVEDSGWSVIKPSFRSFVPAWVVTFIFPLARRGVRRTLKGQGLLRHSRDEIYRIGSDDLDALSAYLGESQFMMGDRPSSIDCTAFGFLVNILRVPVRSPLQEKAAALPNLVAYTARMARLALDNPG